ncbi:hypothetical protein GQ53DRAFT_848483 [Thozetella sp. PMI_491]|nr:hypothetical protein GQ53DRAFT_848483 [Thozetella sp. PMI_491]
MFDIFDHLQFQDAVITRPEFLACLDSFFSHDGSGSDHSTILVKMVLATALFFLGRNEKNSTALKLAEIYFDDTLDLLPRILGTKSSQTLQALLLILRFSLANPRQPIVWHLLGYAIRLATALGLHLGSEENCTPAQGNLNRRLFWALYGLDRAVGNTLGRQGTQLSDHWAPLLTRSRPTALQDFYVDVLFPDTLEDQVGNGRLLLMNHCSKMRQMQSEAADTLYQSIRPYTEQFIPRMQQRADRWLAEAPLAGCDPAAADWIHHAYHNFCMFMHRPSLENPEPSSADLHKCFSSASVVMRLYWKMHKSNSIDATWMAIHWLFLAGVTHMFCIWVDESIRDSVDWSIVYEDMQTTSMVLSALSERWKSAESSPQLYHDLSVGTLRKFAELYPASEYSLSPEMSLG